jgi:hypothetical protein
MFSRRSLATLVTLSALAVMGCGSPRGSVSGIVRFRGTPVTTGSISFHGDNGEVVSSLLATDGSYHIGCLTPGPVRVTVVSHPSVPPSLTVNRMHNVYASPHGPARMGVSQRYWALPDKFSKPDRSGLAYVIESGEQSIDIELTP